MRKARLASEKLQSLNTVQAETFPVGRGKVDSLIEVKSVVETRVVCLRKGHDELACSLIYGINPHASFLQLLGCEKSNQLEQEIRLSFKQLRNCFPHGGFELLSIFAWYAIPCFRCAKMLVIG